MPIVKPPPIPPGMQPRWVIKVLESPLDDTWVELRYNGGRRYRFVDRGEAQQALDNLLASQPHAPYRLFPM